MSRIQRSFENFALLQAASEGDASAVQNALDDGADINASDTSGRTVLTCALTADRWETIDASDASFMSEDRLSVLRIAVSHPDISLYTLNAPQDSINDVTPLGMAAWLDMPEVVQLLLECSSGAVSVDGMDTDGATPLMYAARDCRTEVVRQLLTHGARPDLRDRNHRSSLQFALPHPRVLWACEYALRCYRWDECKNGNKRVLCAPSCVDIDQLSPYSSAPPLPYSPPSTAFSPESAALITDSIVHAVLTADLSLIYSLLFSPQSFEPSPLDNGPILVNAPDVEGWSAIHYCVSVPNPSIEIVDALYRAGADISLFTTGEQYTPLHCLARLACVTDVPDSAQYLYQFAVHLVRDLRAPLSARDKNEETCIHVAAEHGECINVLYALLDCDPTGSIRNMRNSRGFTAFEVAKPHFRSAFSIDAQSNRPQSSLSDRTIRPTTCTSLSSITSFTDWVSPIAPPIHQSAGPASHLPPDFDVISTSEKLLDNFQYFSMAPHLVCDPAGLDNLEHVITETSQLGDDILAHFRGQVDDAAKELRDMREALNTVDRLWNVVSHEAEGQLRFRGNDIPRLAHLLMHKRSPRGSEDSQSTAVEPEPSLPKDKEVKEYADVGVLTEALTTQTIETTSVNGARTVPWPDWLDGFITTDSSVCKVHLANLIEIERELFTRESINSLEEKVPTKEPKLKSLLKSRKRHEKVERSGASKLKTWLKKKIVAGKPLRFQLCYELDEASCAVGREVKQDITQPIITVTDSEGLPVVATKNSRARSTSSSSSSENETRSVRVVLSAASRDLSTIDECLHGIDHLISTANHSISRAERIIKRTVKIRQATVQNLRHRYTPMYDDIFAFSPNAPTPSAYPGLSPSPNSIYLSLPHSNSSSRSSSAHSSLVSLAVTAREEEDEDTKALRRLILRKISAHVDGAYDELDRANTWLRIVKNVLRDLNARTSSSHSSVSVFS
ncbi:hypothetical protein BDN67DRAFT_490026 [Paxillus ammoniavirescens]|nr:hypothetical protein BDN67DRAFT_490026 [Paxillus ammoniavirescens]